MPSSEKNGGKKTTLGSILSGGFLVSASKPISLAFGFVTQIVLSRQLTESTYGQIILVFGVLNIITLLAGLGINQGVARELPHHEDDSAKVKGIFRSSLLLSAVSGVFAGIVLFAVASPLAHLVFKTPSLAGLLRLATIAVPFAVTMKVALGLARGKRNARPQAYINHIAQPVLRFIFISLLLVGGFGATGAIIGQVSAYVFGSLLILLFIHRAIQEIEGNFVEPMYRSILYFSLPLMTLQGMSLINSYIDVFMLAAFLEPTEVGIYNIALQLGNGLAAVLPTIGFLLPPALARLKQEGTKDDLIRIYQSITKWMVLLGFPVFSVLFLIPERVISTIFGPKYAGGALPLQIIVVGKFIAILLGLNINSLVALGENKIVPLILLVQTIINVLMNYLLIPVYGPLGAALALSVSAVTGDILGTAVLYKRFKIHPFSKASLTPLAVLSGVGIVAAIIGAFIADPGLGALFAIAVTYPIVVLMFSIEREDMKLIKQLEDQTGYSFDNLRTVVQKFITN